MPGAAFDPFSAGPSEGEQGFECDVSYVQPPPGKGTPGVVGGKQRQQTFGTPGTMSPSSSPASSADVSPNPSFGSHGNNNTSSSPTAIFRGAGSRPDPLSSNADRSPSDESALTGNTTGRLVKLVKEQVSMVQTLTNANVQNAAELERVKREKAEMEEEYRKMQEQLRLERERPASSASNGGKDVPLERDRSNMTARISNTHSPSAARPSSRFEPAFEPAFNEPEPRLGSIAEISPSNGGGRHADRHGGLPPPPREPPAYGTVVDTYGQPQPERSSAAAGGPRVQMFDDGRGPRASFANNGHPSSSDANRGRVESEDSAGRTVDSIDLMSTHVYPSARNLHDGSSSPRRAEVETAVPSSRNSRNSRSWRGGSRNKMTGSRRFRSDSLDDMSVSTAGTLNTLRTSYTSWLDRRRERSRNRKQPPPPLKKNERGFAAPLPEKTRGDEGSCESRCWASFAFMCTFFVPNCLICKKGPGAKQAWREKVAICVVAFLVSAFFVGFFGFVPLFFCTETDTYTYQDIWSKGDKESWTVIHGTIYDMKDYIAVHPGGSDGILDWLGKDSSKMFPRTPPADLPNKCLNLDKDLEDDQFTKLQCQDFTELDELVGLPCHKDASKARNGVDRWFKNYKAGTLAFSASELTNDRRFDFVVIRDRVYNVTNYVDGLRNENSNMIQKDPDDSDNAYLVPSLHSLIVNKLNEDATEVYDKLYDSDDYAGCLDELYYVGVVDNRHSPACQALNIAMYVILIFVALILVLQCLCSLLYLARPNHGFTKADGEAPVMCMVPCYNEGDSELRKTINSVIETKYPYENKIMVVVADGNITGRGETKSTPEILASILGFEIHPNEDEAHEYRSIGTLRENRANVYSGVYEKGGKALKYIVIVKCGVESEAGSGRAGNRGKRDSQLIVTGLLNRVHHERELCPLDAAIGKALNHLQLPAYELQYLMTIDADTRVHEDSMSHMVYNLNKNDKILALCGETRVDNKAQSIITMLQVFEYYTNHHMKKAFESVFGCVTCLPGCFTMYRVFSTDGRSLIAQDAVYSEYARNDIESLHEKNLYHLGEDRMLTTLLLKNFPDMRLSFVPEAACWTIVPHTFWILLSQRRRWINSTFHNMWELLKVNTMCGICCFSMKTIVILDLIATMVLPASMLYAGYFIYLVFVTGEDISMLMLILYGVIFGVQIVIFLLRSRWDYLFWFAIFMVCGIPLFYFVLPLYSFAKMDDFSWGQTRQVSKQDPKAAQATNRTSSTSADKKAAQRSQVESRSQSRSRGGVRHGESARAGEGSSGNRRPSTSRSGTAESWRSSDVDPEMHRASRSGSRSQSNGRARSSSRDVQDAERLRRVQARRDAERRRQREAERSRRHSRQNSADLGEC